MERSLNWIARFASVASQAMGGHLQLATASLGETRSAPSKPGSREKKSIFPERLVQKRLDLRPVYARRSDRRARRLLAPRVFDLLLVAEDRLQPVAHERPGAHVFRRCSPSRSRAPGSAAAARPWSPGRPGPDGGRGRQETGSPGLETGDRGFGRSGPGRLKGTPKRMARHPGPHRDPSLGSTDAQANAFINESI
jgi:hypothetical protein